MKILTTYGLNARPSYISDERSESHYGLPVLVDEVTDEVIDSPNPDEVIIRGSGPLSTLDKSFEVAACKLFDRVESGQITLTNTPKGSHE